MIPANSLQSIVRMIDQSLGVTKKMVREPVPELGYMQPGQPPRIRYQTVEKQTEQWSKLVGMLYCMPGSKLGKDEILPNLSYFHHRSGTFVDFYCVGYGADWQPSDYSDKSVVTKVDNVEWLFSAKEFNSCRAELESISRWQYSGETELLLLVAKKQGSVLAKLDLSTAISCNLEEMVKDGAFTSVRAFFEKVFRFGEQFKGENPVWELSDKMGISVGKNYLQEAILTLVPKTLHAAYKSARHYVIKDISK